MGVVPGGEAEWGCVLSSHMGPGDGLWGTLGNLRVFTPPGGAGSTQHQEGERAWEKGRDGDEGGRSLRVSVSISDLLLPAGSSVLP